MAKKESSTPPVSFEQAVSELESLVEAMEHDELPLEQALSNYQRGMGLLKHCQTILGTAEQRVRMLEQGQLQDLPDSNHGSES